MADTEIRELVSETDWKTAFQVVKQLRDTLNEDEYLDYLARMTADGYRLFGLFLGDELVTVAGVNISTNMYHGRHLWISELVTDSEHRSRGFGKKLFEYLVEWAESRRCEKVALPSGLQRADAHRFYEQDVSMESMGYIFARDVGES